MSNTPLIESLETRLCLSATHHHFYTGVRPHYTVVVAARHHRTHTVLSNPPAVFGEIPTVPGSNPTTPNSPINNTGLFGGSGGGLFGGGGSIFT